MHRERLDFLRGCREDKQRGLLRAPLGLNWQRPCRQQTGTPSYGSGTYELTARTDKCRCSCLIFQLILHLHDVFLSCEVGDLNPPGYELVKLEHKYSAGLRNRRICPLDFVDTSLNASRVEIPACRHGDILLAVDLK